MKTCVPKTCTNPLLLCIQHVTRFFSRQKNPDVLRAISAISLSLLFSPNCADDVAVQLEFMLQGVEGGWPLAVYLAAWLTTSKLGPVEKECNDQTYSK